MFHSKHVKGLLHATARAVSGEEARALARQQPSSVTMLALF
jgi:hypothetical protein